MKTQSTAAPPETPANTQRSDGWMGRLVLRLLGKTPKKEPTPEPAPWWRGSWERLMKEYPCGRKFQYLGREMIVVRYKLWNPGSCRLIRHGIYIPPAYPAMVSQYADETGRIRDHEWGFSSWAVLLESAKGDSQSPAKNL